MAFAFLTLPGIEPAYLNFQVHTLIHSAKAAYASIGCGGIWAQFSPGPCPCPCPCPCITFARCHLHSQHFRSQLAASMGDLEMAEIDLEMAEIEREKEREIDRETERAIQPSSHLAIQPSSHPGIQASRHPGIQASRQPSRHPAIFISILVFPMRLTRWRGSFSPCCCQPWPRPMPIKVRCDG